MADKYTKVSIITVVYNGVKTIEQTILSVLEQTYTNIEYIIIDGQSTDGTQQIVEKYKDSIAYFVSEKDNGIYDAMNKGIERATGDIIGIINSDDWYVPDAVEKVVHYFNYNGADIVYGKAMNVFQNGREQLYPALPLEAIWYQMIVPHPTVFVKRVTYQKYGAFNLKYKLASDYDLLLKFYVNHLQIGFIDHIMTYFRVGGLSTRMQIECMKEHIAIATGYIKTYSDHPGQLLDKLEEWCKETYFWRALRVEKNTLSQLVNNYFGEELSELIIFGAGSWGIRCCELLEGGEISVKLFADNDISKWNQTVEGIKVVSPQEIYDMEIPVLTAVRNEGDRIKRQLEGMGNRMVKCVDLEALKDIYLEGISYAPLNTEEA